MSWIPRYPTFLFLMAIGDPAFTAETVEYNRDILPLLSDRCFHCHGPDEHTREGGVRFDVEASAKGQADSGENAVVPGDADASELIRRIMSDDEFEQMPPPHSRKQPLDDEQIELIRRWIDQGAEYQTHWAYVSPRERELASSNRAGKQRNWIDQMIQERLANEGLQPAPEADRVTLIRRLAFDLTGLPPAREDVAAFVNDSSTDAYEKVVDRFLQSDRYGERMAMWWLDLVRYADTVGYHGDQDHRVWPYRDWVIRAFNANVPFDQFSIEQIAGDLLPDPTQDQLIATAYNRLLQTTHEGGAQLKEYRAIYQADRIRNLSQVWMGATIGCAQCHNHKYDPYTSKDFYALGAFFADIDDEEHLRNQYGGLNKLPTRRSPEMPVRSKEAERQLAELRERLVSAESHLRDVRSRLLDQLPAMETKAREKHDRREETEETWVDDVHDTGGTLSGDWQFVSGEDVPVFSGKRSRLQASQGQVQHYFNDAKKVFRLGESASLFAWVYLDPANPPEALMLQFNIAGDWEHRAVWGNDKISYGRKNESHNGYRRQGALPELGKWVRLQVNAEGVGLKTGTVVNGMAFSQYGGRAYWDRAGQHQSSALPTHVLEAMEVKNEKRTDDQKQAIQEYLLNHAEELTQPKRAVAQLEQEIKAFEDSLPQVVYTKTLDEPRVVRVLPRGNWLDETGEIVQPAIPAFMGELDVEDRRANRLDLARWMFAPTESDGIGPLTARVHVNRFWQLLMVTGISRVLDDFGGQGEPPVHPELLDQLAIEFVDSGWNIKAMMKRIVMSHTYRQSSVSDSRTRTLDPDNRLYAVQSRPRLQAEMIRDVTLSVSGLLNQSLGGPSVKPYQPDGYYSHLNFPTRRYKQDEDSQQWRRGLYVHWQRQFLHPMLRAFDAPTREECTAQRSISNTPTAALVMLNDPTFVEAARVFASRILIAGGKHDIDRLRWAFSEVVSRQPGPEEIELLQSLLNRHRKHFADHPTEASEVMKTGMAPLDSDQDASELAAWTSVARSILNLNETITRN